MARHVDDLRELLNRRVAAGEDGITDLARRADVDKGSLSKFLAGKWKSIGHDSLERLAVAVDREIVVRKAKKSK
jgi:transcriptional regulator with XRE-family HTH domain